MYETKKCFCILCFGFQRLFTIFPPPTSLKTRLLLSSLHPVHLRSCHADVFKASQVLCSPLLVQMLFLNRLSPNPLTHQIFILVTPYSLLEPLYVGTHLSEASACYAQDPGHYTNTPLGGTCHIVLWFICFLFVPGILLNILNSIIMF